MREEFADDGGPFQKTSYFGEKLSYPTFTRAWNILLEMFFKRLFSARHLEYHPGQGFVKCHILNPNKTRRRRLILIDSIASYNGYGRKKGLMILTYLVPR